MNTKGKKQILKKRLLFRDEIRGYIEEAILSNKLKPGDRIVETRWARELGVSQAPVREAMRELEMIGLVENLPFKGSYVKKISIKDVKDSYYVRMSLEMLGMKEAIKIVTDLELKEIYCLMKEMEVAAQNHEFDLYIKKDTSFHQKIIKVSKNEILQRVWNQCYIRERTYIGTKLSDRSLQNLSARHEEIYDALKARDEERAVKAVITHFEELILEVEAKPIK